MIASLKEYLPSGAADDLTIAELYDMAGSNSVTDAAEFLIYLINEENEK